MTKFVYRKRNTNKNNRFKNIYNKQIKFKEFQCLKFYKFKRQEECKDKLKKFEK